MNEYLSELYNWISSQDNTFQGRRSKEEFISKMQNDSEYNQQMYSWISGVDDTFKNRYTTEAFQSKTGLKKKGQSDSASPADIMDSITEEEDIPVLSASLYENDEESEISKKLNANTRRIGSSLSRIPLFLAEQVFTMTASKDVKDIFNSMPVKERENLISSIARGSAAPVGAGGILGRLTPDATDFYQEQKDKIDKIESTYKKYETSLGEDYANLDLSQALNRTFVEVIGGAPQLIQAMIPGVGLASIALGSAAEKSGELQREGEDLGIRTSLNSIVFGAAEGIFEVVTRKLGKKILDGFKINPDETIKTLGKNLKELFIDANLEGGSEAATSVVQNLSDALIQGKEIDFYDALRETIDSYIIGAGTGGTLTGSGKSISAIKNIAQKSKISRKIKDSKYNTLDDVFMPAVNSDGSITDKTNIDQLTIDIASSPVSRKFVVEGLNKSVKSGKLTKEEADKRLSDFDNIREASSKTSKDIKGDSRIKAVDLIREKKSIQNEIEGIDPALTKNKEARINEINNELEKIANAIQEQETRDIPDAQPAEGVQEMETEVREPVTEEPEEEVGILNKSIEVSDSKGKKGLVPISELEPFIGEDRVGDAAMPTSRETIDKLKKDIKKNGFKEPIVVLYDKFSNGGEATIIEGNHRYVAAKELGLKEIPVTFEKGTIRSNEKRAKDQMFPLNRKTVGKINDTFGVKGSDLGLTVRQPIESDYKKAKQEEVREPPAKKEASITPETSSNYANLTEDDEGNFVFYHVGSEGYSQVKPRSGATKATSGEERAALSKVGGMAMYYTKASDGESMVSGSTKYEVKVPKDKVYDFNSDPLNLKKEAKERHDAENPVKGYDNNSELAYVAKIAEEKGFDMVVAEWDGKTRAQTTKALVPNDTQVREGNTVVKPFKNQYKSNADKGFVPVIPESKRSKLDALYNKIYKERNNQNKYDDLYRLQENSVKMSQEEITDLIEGSDISQEIKDEYKQILETEEGKRKSVKKMDEYASSEVDRVKKLTLEAEDGATMNLDGSKYENGGLVIPVASVNMKASELTTEAIEKFIEENSESIGADNVKVGIYKFPNSDQVSIDINIVADRSMREEALKIGKELGQESLFDLDTFENIKTGADGKNPKKLSPKEFLEIQKRLSKTETKDTLGNELESFANRIVEDGIEFLSDDALQFYADNKEALDKIIQEKQKQKPKTESKARSLALKIVEGKQDFSDSEIDLFATNEEKIRSEVDSIANTRGVQITSDNYKNIIKSTKRPRKKVSTDEYAALKDQIRLEARAARGAKIDINKRRKELADSIRALVKTGKISTKQAQSIINRISNVNVYNEKSVNKLISYMDKVYENADYADKLSQANKLRKEIKKGLKDNEATLSNAAEMFSKIDPSMLDDIDTYIEKAISLKEGLKKSTKIKLSVGVDIADITEYSNKSNDEINNKIIEEKSAEFQEVTGADPKDFSYEEMLEILYAVEGSEKKLEKVDKDKAIREYSKKTYKYYAPIIESYLKGIDPFTGEKVSVDNKQLIRDFLNVNRDNLKTSTLLKYMDSLINLASNPNATGGIGVVVSRDTGNKNAKGLLSKGIKSLRLGKIGRAWNEHLSTMPLLFEQLFGGQSKAEKADKASGFTTLAKAYTRADIYVNEKFGGYLKKYRKSKPNKKKFTNIENIYERAVIARIQRTFEGAQKEEFLRQKDLIKQSYEKLLIEEPRKGELYKKVYDKLLEGSNSIDDVLSKADNINVKAISDMQSLWAEILPKLKDVSLNYYNKIISEDINYTPDFFSKLDTTEEIEDIEGTYNFMDASEAVYDKKTGTLNKNQRVKRIGKNIVDLNFEMRSFMALQDAMRDVESADAIQQVIGFLNSKSYEKIFPNTKTGDILRTRLSNYARVKRNKDFTEKGSREFNKLFNRVAKIGVARALAGITQPIKQSIVLVQTFSKEPINTFKAMYLLASSKEAREFINKSNATVALRGSGSVTTLESSEKAYNASTESRVNRFVKVFSNLSETYLDWLLVKPDVAAAKVSFLAFYLGKGGDINNIDSDKVDYADKQVARMQNTSDEDMQGKFYTTKSGTADFIRKTLFPFSNFNINQKTRTYSDFNVLRRFRSESTDDVLAAGSSILRTTSEMVVFHTVGYYITSFLTNLAYSLIGFGEDDEKEKKRKMNQFKGRLTSMTTDVMSPLPLTDPFITSSVNFVLKNIQSGDDPILLFSNDEKTALERLGTLGIAPSKALAVYELMKIISTGKYKNKYGKEVELSNRAISNMESVLLPYILYNMGVMPTETGYVSEKIISASKKLKASDTNIPLISIDDNRLMSKGLNKSTLKKSTLKK